MPSPFSLLFFIFTLSPGPSSVPGLLNKSHGICKNCLGAADKDVRSGRSFRLVIRPGENFVKIVRTFCLKGLPRHFINREFISAFYLGRK